jgi:hypothetical protein
MPSFSTARPLAARAAKRFSGMGPGFLSTPARRRSKRTTEARRCGQEQER